MIINAEAVSRRDAEIIENLLSEQVLDAAIEVHRTLGLVINFGQGRFIDGWERVVNNL
jgi:hypothetical protein